MLKIKSGFLIALCCILICGMFSFAQAHEACESNGPTVVVINDAGEVVLTVGFDSPVPCEEVGRYVFPLIGKEKEDIAFLGDGSAITPKGIVCCVQNPPQKRLKIEYHAIIENTDLRMLSRFNIWVCNYCNATLRQSSITTSSHTRGTGDCPY